MSNPTRKICKYCSTETDINDQNCDNCGSVHFTAITPAAPPPVAPQPRPVTVSTPSANASDSSQKKKKNPLISGLFVIVIIAGIVLSTVIPLMNSGNDNDNNGKTTPPATTSYEMNQQIQTDWFRMKVTAVDTKDGSSGNIAAASYGYDLVFVEVFINNYLLTEDLDVNINTDFYIESSTQSKIHAENTGGNYSLFDELNEDGLFYDVFMLSPGSSLQGSIAYYIPRDTSNLRFVYEEWNWDGDTRVSVKKYHKVSLPYTPPSVTILTAENFTEKATDAGYEFEIMPYEGPYDPDPKLIHVKKFAANAGPDDEPLYTIIFIHYWSSNTALVEFNSNIEKLTEIGGDIVKDLGKNYQYQTNSSASSFGAAYKAKDDNLFVIADAQYKDEITDFFDSLGYAI